MSRTLNRALLAQLQAHAVQTKPALESDDVSSLEVGGATDTTVVPTEGDAATTATAVAAGAGEVGEAAPAAPVAKVVVEVKVETPDTVASGAAVPEAAPVAGADGAPVDAGAPADDLAAAAAGAEAAPADATDGAAPATGEGEGEGATAAAEVPVEGGEEAASGEGEAGGEGTEGGEATAAAEVPATGEAAAAPAEGEAAAATPEAAAETAPAGAGGEETTVEVDAKPTQADEDAAAADVQQAIDATKSGDEQETETKIGEEAAAPAEVAPVGDVTPGSEAALPVIDEVESIASSEVAPEIDEIAGELDTYQDSAETLAKIAKILEAAAEEGGMNGTAAAVTEVAVEHIHQQLGIPKPIAFVSMEAFDMPGQRIEGTVLAMEEVSKTVKEVWQTILASMQNFMKMVHEFYNKLASGAVVQKKMADGMLATAQKLGDKKVAGQISSPSLAKKLAMHNQVSQNLAADLVTTGRTCTAALQQGAVLAQTANSLLTATDMGAAKASVLEAVTKAVNAIMNVNNEPTMVGVNPEEGTYTFTSPVLLGNHVLWAHVPGDVENLSKASFGTSAFDVQLNNTNLPILNSEQIINLCKLVSSQAGILSDLRNTENLIKTAMASFQAYANKAASDEGAPDGTVVKMTKELTQGLLRNAAKVLYQNNGAVLDYCKASLVKMGVQGAKEAAGSAAEAVGEAADKAGAAVGNAAAAAKNAVGGGAAAA